MSYKVSVIVNDEPEDPKPQIVGSWARAEALAESYVDMAQTRGTFYLYEFTSSSWRLTDDDGDRVQILIEKS